MSTRTAFTVVGTVIGAYFGNPALGATIGSMVGGYVDPVKVKGPRLTDAQQQTSQDGVPIPLTFGVVRIQGNIIATGPLVEHKHKDDGKGSGTETTTYTYTRTYAIAICEGPIAGIRRIWKNGKLVYDGRPPDIHSPQDVLARIALYQFLNSHTLYFGDEDQMVDGELEAVLGAGEVPAFRGLAYMVSVDEDVTDTAGAIPTYEFEVISKGTSYVDFELVPTSYPGILPWGLQPEGKRDPRFVLGDYLYGPLFFGETVNYNHDNLEDAVQEAVSHFGDRPYTAIPVAMGWAHSASSGARGMVTSLGIFTDLPRGDTLNQNTSEAITLLIPREQFQSHSALIGVGGGGSYGPCSAFDGGQWAAKFTAAVSPTPPLDSQATLWSSGVMMYTEDPDQIANADDTLLVPDHPGANPCTGRPSGLMYHFGDYLISVKPLQGCSQAIDPEWMPVPGSLGLYVDRYGNYHSIHDCSIVSGSFRQLAKLAINDAGTNFLQAPTGPVLVTGSADDTQAFWEAAYEQAVAMQEVPAGWTYGTEYPVAVGQACYCAVGLVVEEGDVSLAEIVSTLCVRAGMHPTEINVSELTERVIGFTVATQTDAADAINVLAPGFFFDGSEWDGVTHFVKRGHNHVEVLTFDDSVETDDPRIKETRAQELELPATFVLSYFDPAADLAITTQRAARRAVTVKATGQDNLQIPVAMSSDQAAQVADMLMKDKWSSLQGTIEQTIADEFSYLTPTDVVQVQSDGAVFRVRLGPITSQEGTLQYEGIQDVQSAYTSDVEGLAPPTPVVGIDGPFSPTLALYYDLPALRDRDDQVGVYVAATGVTGKWRGALIEVSRDGGLTWQSALNLTQASTVGQLMTDVPSWTPDIPQYGGAADVRLTSGELVSITEAQWFNQGNGAVMGAGELMQFQTATLIEVGQYHTAKFIRGRKSTQPVAHAIGDNFALLDSLYFLPLQRSDIGASLKFRAVTLGTANSEGIVTDFDFTQARSVTEWAPTDIHASRATDGALTLSWSPRHRLGNANAPYASLYFSGFQITFTSGSTSRSYTTTAQNFEYTAAMQTADFGAVTDPLTYTIAATNTIKGAGDTAGGTA